MAVTASNRETTAEYKWKLRGCHARFPQWSAWSGVVFALLFLVGAFLNAVPAVQTVADLNNALLPLWMLVLGVSLIWYSRRA